MKLYHSSPVALDVVELTPRTRNIRLSEGNDGTPVAHFTEYADTNPPFVYATDNQSLSLTYAIPKGVRLGNMHGHGGAEIVFLDRESKIGDPDLRGGIYSFHSENFVQVHNNAGQPTGQWVSALPVNLQQADFRRIETLNDLMREGVQVYQIADHYDIDAFYTEIFESGRSGDETLGILDRLVDEGKMRWVNEERMIRADNCLRTTCSEPQAQPEQSFKPLSL